MDRIRIVSSGTSAATLVYMGDRVVPGVVKVEWSCEATEVATAVIHVSDVYIDAAFPADLARFLVVPAEPRPDPEEQP